MASLLSTTGLTLFVITCEVLVGATTVQQNQAVLLQEAVNYLVNYTALEALELLDLNDTGSKIAEIAFNDYRSKLAVQLPRHCNDFTRLNKPLSSKLTLIKPDEGEPFFVYCHMDHFGGGWTRIHQRSTRKMSFARNWYSYKHGFGYLSGDGWLGLEKMHRLTKHRSAELLIRIQDNSNNLYFPQYKNFQVGSEATQYTLYIGNFTGDGGDSLSYSNKAKFSTYDKDHDTNSGNCASSSYGGWWYYSCAQGKLTGLPYSSSSSNNYVRWPSVSNTAIYHTTMEIRISNN